VWCNESSGTPDNDSETVYFSVDLTKPFVNITSPLNGTTYTTDTFLVRGYANENVSQCLAETDSLTNTSMTNSSGDWNVNTPALGNGEHSIRIYCRDEAGNWNNSETVNVTVAVEAAQAPSSGGGGGGTGLRPNITVIEIKDKEGFFVYMDNLMSNVKYDFPYSWPTDLRISFMKFKNLINDKEMEIRERASTSAPAPTGNVYKYYVVSESEVPFSSVINMGFSYHVRIDWIENTGADVNKMKLYGYDGIVWNELDSHADFSNGTYIYYNATGNGFYEIYAIAEAGAEAKDIPFINVLYAIEKYYDEEIGFLDVISVISDYYLGRI
jgi:PGF-pre-PGF domain-containing protein